MKSIASQSHGKYRRGSSTTCTFKRARQVLFIGVVFYGSDPPGRPFNDGYITSRATFQKYFGQAEFKDFIEHVLYQEVFVIGLGVAFAFADR